MMADAPLQSRRPWLLWVALLIVAVCFAPVISNSYAPVDDTKMIIYEPRLNPPQFSAAGVGSFWTDRFGEARTYELYMPLTETIWAVLAKATYVQTPDEHRSHLDVRVFHATSLAFHLLNVALVYLLLRHLLRLRVANGFRRDFAAAAGALFFGLHPLQVEAVAWMTGLKDLMCVSASLGAVLLYLRAVSGTGGGSSRVCYVAGLLLVPIGMVCKPTTMMAPVIAGALDLLIVRRPLRKVLLAAVPYAIAAVPLAVLARHLQSGEGVPMPPVWQRPAVAGSALAFYFWKLVFPVNVAFDYGRAMSRIGQLPLFPVGGFAVVLAILALVAISMVLRWRWVAAAIVVFVAGLLPALGFTAFKFAMYSVVADHYLALSMLAPAMLVAFAISALPAKAIASAIGVCVVVAVVYGALVVRQVSFWKDPPTFAKHINAVAPHNSLGHEVLAEYYHGKNDLKAAVPELEAAAENDYFYDPMVALAYSYAQLGRPRDCVRAVERFVLLSSRNPKMKQGLDRFIPDGIVKTAYASGHARDVPLYMAEQRKLFGDPATAPATRRLQK